MRLLFFIIFFTTLAPVLAQKKLAKVNVECVKINGPTLEGEEIIFQSEKTGAVVKGVTGPDGRFSCELTGPDQYKIIVKSLTGLTDYSRFILPTIDNEKLYPTYEITVEIEPATEYTLDNVYFETASASLKKESFAELNELVYFMQRKPKARIEIGGHTDNVGSEESNLTLSENRARAVRQYLLDRGISPFRVAAKGYGECQPIANNLTEEGRQQNRRTAVKILEE